MKRLSFNFNNEVDTFEIIQEDDGRVTVPGPDNTTLAEYASLEQFAEMYALARDVHPDHLKNWQLLENGDVVSFVLRAGTAGISAEDVRQDLDNAIQFVEESGTFHALDIARLRNEITHAGDIVHALAMASVPDAARQVYDYLESHGAFAEPEPEPVDERTEIEAYLDSVMERDGSLAFFAHMLGVATDASREAVVAAMAEQTVPYTVPMLRSLYNDALGTAIDEGIGVFDNFDALLVTTQAVPCLADESAKAKVKAMAALAKRAKVNLKTYVVGHKHIRKTATLVPVGELDGMDVYMRENLPITVRFDQAVDEELEEERRQEELEEELEGSHDDGFDDDFDDEDDFDSFDEGYME